jgi:hypothetical protein
MILNCIEYRLITLNCSNGEYINNNNKLILNLFILFGKKPKAKLFTLESLIFVFILTYYFTFSLKVNLNLFLVLKNPIKL